MNNSTNMVGQMIGNIYQNVLLLSPAEIEGPSDFTRRELLLLISSPCSLPRGSCCNVSEKACDWAVASIAGRGPDGLG